MKRWILHPVQSYNRVFVCPHWGHKPYGSYGWHRAKQTGVLGTCERCGEYAGTQ